MCIVQELDTCIPLQKRNLPQEESEGVEPWQQYTSKNFLDALFPEAKILGFHDGRVNQEQPGRRLSTPEDEKNRLRTEEHRPRIY